MKTDKNVLAGRFCIISKVMRRSASKLAVKAATTFTSGNYNVNGLYDITVVLPRSASKGSVSLKWDVYI